MPLVNQRYDDQMSLDNRRTVQATSNGDLVANTDDSTKREVRRRPKNRRAQIAGAAASAFGSLGYHGVSMEDIASGLGISSAALYRHFPSKYALFREELLRVGQALADSVHLPESMAEATPEQRLGRVIDALIGVTASNRSSVALVRWEERYLTDEDRAHLDELQTGVLIALGTELALLRPELTVDDRRVLVATLVSVVTSIADHHATLPPKTLTALLSAACRDVAGAELPAPRADDPVPEVEIPESFKHELLLRKAVDLFHARGYPNVSVEDIATATGLSAASAVYRFYRSKGDLLAAAFRRAADRVSSAIGPAVSATNDPEAALVSLIDQYVDGSFAERSLTFVYYTEFQHVPPEERTSLRNIQRVSVAEWARLLCEVRPDLSAAQARFLVHAAFALVVDLGRAFGSTPITSRPRVKLLMQTVLFGRPTQ